ncbi:cytochrome c1 [Pinisolibacter aquiterrae]|uniref:cytochrome c1 n=1 Tax=Pinisolibacter aquiterrae TaxID=2815579 RepID=UPI001E5F184E|nr:cytochrome c1 [Pinisolibacter aquiterrae]MBV5263387.1 cytochrome c1 [Pinisolibacter aquiterrae]MCC8237535.1 cytochrome c1 [Pinisolibacter aquiterrae]
MTMILSVTKIGRAMGAAALVAGLAFAAPAFASEAGGPVVETQSWSFAGPFGRFDKAQLQRGYKVYKEVCSTCHSMNLVSFRNLADAGGPGFTMDQAKALAATIKVKDGPNDAGEMFERDGRPSDRFAAPFPNDEAARASFGGALPPDLSLIAKARAVHRGGASFLGDPFTLYAEAGPDYVYNLLTGYVEAPHGVTCDGALQYNQSFIGGTCIAMPPPLTDDIVTYDDGTKGTVQNYARDVAAFLMWTAEPKLEARKSTGLKVMMFLIVFAGLLYLTKRKVWSSVAH